MKIAVVGAHGTGKTTLAKILADQLNIELIEEVARGLLRKCARRADQLKGDTLKGFQTLTSLSTHHLHTTTENFVADRSIHDCNAYDNGLTGWDYDELKVKYDLLIYVPIEFGIDDDGVRHVDPEYQKFIDERIKKLIDDCGDLVLQVTPGMTAIERANSIVAAMQLMDLLPRKVA